MKKIIFALLTALLVLFSFTSCLGSEGTGATTTTTTTPVSPIPEGSSFAVHFIDVGQADAALVFCDDQVMMIDGGNREDSNLIYAYLQKHNVEHIDYMVCTHAHEDHVGGLSGALTYATVGVVYAPVKEASTQVFTNFVNKVAEREREITIPSVGTTFSLGSATVTIVGPVKNYTDTNDTSIVLRVVYGETSFLFTGDMESSAEADLIASGAVLSSTVLKVGHHGSSTSSSYRFIREVAPKYAVISVGTDNSYGHPEDSVLSRLRDADVQLYRTDLQGDVICSSDGTNVTFTTQKNSSVQTNPTVSQGTTSSNNAVTEYAYIGNINSKIFHTPECGSLPNESNRIYFTTRQEAIDNEYTACGKCKP